MGRKKVGELIKEARTNAGMTQEQLARKVKDTSASDISKAERGELELNKDQLKAIAKATGVTQKSLLDAAAGKTGTAKKPAVAKKTTGTSVKVTAKEKKVLELYRSATTDNKKLAVAILKGDIVKSDVLAAQVLGNPAVISNISGFFDNLI